MNGLRQGKGKFAYLNGCHYDGYWVANEKEGQGLLIYANEDTYDGNWRKG